jgi:hypothetical protein
MQIHPSWPVRFDSVDAVDFPVATAEHCPTNGDIRPQSDLRCCQNPHRKAVAGTTFLAVTWPSLSLLINRHRLFHVIVWSHQASGVITLSLSLSLSLLFLSNNTHKGTKGGGGISILDEVDKNRVLGKVLAAENYYDHFALSKFGIC